MSNRNAKNEKFKDFTGKTELSSGLLQFGGQKTEQQHTVDDRINVG